MTTDANVVTDLHLIVDLGTLADDRIVHGSAVDRRLGTDFDVILNDDAADLHDLDHAGWARCITETVLADPSAIVDDHMIADQPHNMLVPPAIMHSRPILTPLPIIAPGPMRVPTDCDMRPDHCIGLNRNAGLQNSCRMNGSQRRNALTFRYGLRETADGWRICPARANAAWGFFATNAGICSGIRKEAPHHK